MSDAAAPKKSGLFRTILVGSLGLCGGAVGTYTTAVVEKIAKPPLPIANFAVSADGLAVTCMNHATGDTGWWDYGDGSPLEPFAADQPTITHTYAKPGSYSVKLVVRNFTSDENERTVAVEAAAAAKDAAGAPQITGFAVQPVSPGSVAPAVFRVTADVQNADYCVWDFGDGRVEAAAGGGKIDRTVTFENPGPATVQLVAHNGKAAAQQAAAVKVESAPAGSLTAVLKVTDGGQRSERHTRSLTVAIPAPKDKAGPAFTRTIAARPGATLVEVVSAKADVPGVKNLRVAVAPDKKTATITGEWADPKVAKAGSDALIPLKLTDERASTKPPVVATVLGQLPPLSTAGKTSTAIALPAPPAPIDGMSRTIHVELRQTGTNGKSVVIAEGDLIGRGLVTIPARQYVSLPMPPVTTASYEIDTVKIAFEVRPSGVVPAGGP